MRRSIPWTTFIVCLAVLPTGAQDDTEELRESGLVEQARGRLMQIDVTARGPAEILAALTSDNFTVAVGREDIQEFVLDRVCIDDPIEGLELATREIVEAAPRLRTLLYFDQMHLTAAGRQRAFQLARDLIPELVARGGRSEAMLVSAGRRLEVLVEWTSDTDALLAGVDRLAAAPEHVLTWADEEDQRVQQLMSAIDRSTKLYNDAIRLLQLQQRQNATEELERTPMSLASGQQRRRERNNIQQRSDNEAALKNVAERARVFARKTARDLSRKESSRTSGGLNLFAVALEHLDAYAPPKAVVYFADTMRANPGDFYVDLVKAAESGHSKTRPAGSQPMLSTGNYVREFQGVIDLSTEKGVRLYTVQGRGLTAQGSPRPRMGAARVVAADPFAHKARFKDAENALSGLARETGGKSFLGAADATQIASRILDDLSCLFVLSFRPIDLKTDRATPVWINVDQPGVELQYRPHLIALSDEARSKARLTAAFWGSARERSPARVLAIPTGFEKGKYTVLVQFAIPGSESSDSDWDMGFTAVVGTSTTKEASGRVAVNQPGLPLVFEAEMRIKPGDYSISAVARNRKHDEILSKKKEGTLPDPDEGDPFVAATTLLQRVPGAFARGETTKTTGSLGHGPDHWLRPDRPTGILALVCGSKIAGPVTVVRRLEGAGVVSFDPVEMDFRQERCGLLVDTVDAGILTSGRFSYSVDLADDDGIRQASMQEFLVVTPQEIAAARLDSKE